MAETPVFGQVSRETRGLYANILSGEAVQCSIEFTD